MSLSVTIPLFRYVGYIPDWCTLILSLCGVVGGHCGQHQGAAQQLTGQHGAASHCTRPGARGSILYIWSQETLTHEHADIQTH